VFVHNQLDEISGESIHAALIEKRSYMLSCLSLTTTALPKPIWQA